MDATTLKPGQALYMPAGYIVFERVTSTTSGLSLRVWVPAHVGGYEAIQKEGTATATLATERMDVHNAKIKHSVAST